jgi:L-ascorbate metabolism protein UlaG (beta-lactamase superfamily)
MDLIRLDLNSWILKIAGKTILIDPWLVDPLVFYGMPWLFKACRQHPPAYSPATLPTIDLILISQSLDDHCHQPTLAQLDRTIPVLATPVAAKIAKKLGFVDVQALSTWQEYTLGSVQIIATPGAPLPGSFPPQLENGYFLKDQEQGETVYYEPHFFRPEEKIEQRLGQVDVAIAPVTGLTVCLQGQVVMGSTQTMALVKALQPRIFVPNGLGELVSSGLLQFISRAVGSLEEFRELLAASGLPTQLLVPESGENLHLSTSLIGT